MRFMANGKKDAEENKNAKEDKKEAKQEPKAEEKVEDVKDRLLRLAAEFDNYKKKAAKDIDNAKGIGKAELARTLLPMLDEFELALMSLNGSEGSKDHMKGVELVFSNILGTLKSAGLKEVDAKGRYDPYRHEIIMTRESKEPEGTIIEVVRKGYTFNDVMLRPSAVIVSNGNVSKGE
jgi:molecular chaperone GrpE